MSLDLSAPDDAPDLPPSVDVQSLLERIQTVETRAADAAAPDEVAARLDRIETRLARPSARVEVREDVDELEKKAFLNYCRCGNDALSDHDRRVLGDVEKKVLAVGGGSPELGGSHLVPEVLLREIVKNLVLISPIRSVARVQTVSAGPVLVPKRVDTITGQWVAETAQHGTDEPTYVQQSVGVHEARVTVEISNQLLEDSAFDLAAEMARDLAEAFARLEGEAFVTGSGSGQPSGFLVDSALPVTDASGLITADR